MIRKGHRPSILVAIPCLNEEATVGPLVSGFRAALPDATICVYDNHSSDRTIEAAEAAGAVIHHVRARGKGNVIRAIFESARAEIVVIIDGDGTYHPEDVELLLGPILSGEADMVVGDRLSDRSADSIRGHRWVGNRLVVMMINRLYGSSFRDVLSGYRALGPRVLDRLSVLTTGFEIETELTARALAEGLTITEVPVRYSARPHESHSKLEPVADGYRILLTAVILLRDLFPLRFFGITSVLLLAVAVTMAVLRILDYAGVVSTSPSLATGLLSLCAILSLLSFGIGLVISTVNTRARELADIVSRQGDS